MAHNLLDGISLMTNYFNKVLLMLLVISKMWWLCAFIQLDCRIFHLLIIIMVELVCLYKNSRLNRSSVLKLVIILCLSLI